ncbi:MAG: LysM peptidoglycan-binding domain-containing protein, partial [Verrucomicrobiota bacterium]|nr:LysM peptidoglycan-binding domain-containing protein [Verrucomicrobiota bacterium]
MLLPPSLWAQTITYKVKKGDTLGKIALRLNTSTNELKRANNLNSDLIQVGQKLTIPTGNNTNIAGFSPIAMSNYIVVKGDTLSKIAARHGISIRELKAMNNLNRDLILVGQNLRIPANATRQTVPTEDLMAKVRASTARIKIHRDKWQHIIVHHSAIKYGNVEKYDAAHRLRGMQNGLAYHFLIGNGIDAGEGEIEIGPRWQKQQPGGHVKNPLINQTAIGICLIGNFEKTHPSKKQLAAFTQLVDWLQGVALGKKVHFAGHRELKGEQTVCPGKHFPLARMHARIAAPYTWLSGRAGSLLTVSRSSTSWSARSHCPVFPSASMAA